MFELIENKSNKNNKKSNEYNHQQIIKEKTFYISAWTRRRRCRVPMLVLSKGGGLIICFMVWILLVSYHTSLYAYDKILMWWSTRAFSRTSLPRTVIVRFIITNDPTSTINSLPITISSLCWCSCLHATSILSQYCYSFRILAHRHAEILLLMHDLHF